MKAGVVCVALLALSSCSGFASADRGIAVKAGFAFGNDFTIGPRTTHLEGIEVGADIRLKRFGAVGELSLSPSVAFGGSTRSGADADGTIIRVLATIRHAVSPTAYLGGGLGWSGVEARAGQFSVDNGFATALLAGWNFRPVGAGSTTPFAEVTYFDGPTNKLRGWSVNVGLRF